MQWQGIDSLYGEAKEADESPACAVDSSVADTDCEVCQIEKHINRSHDEEAARGLEKLRKAGPSPEVFIRQVKQLPSSTPGKAGGRTLCYMAAERGCSQSLRLLLSMGADPLRQIELGSTALHAAAFYNHPECVEAILRHERLRSPNRSLQTTNIHRFTAYDEGKSHPSIRRLFETLSHPSLYVLPTRGLT
jgi:hypothetical protein